MTFIYQNSIIRLIVTFLRRYNMSKCPVCHYDNKSEVGFCVSCGAAIEESSGTKPSDSNQRVKNKPTSNKKMLFIVTAVIVLSIEFITSYQLFDITYSHDAV